MKTFFLFLFLCSGLTLYCQNAYEILKIPVTISSSALGGINVSQTSNGTEYIQNPALLINNKKYNFSTAYNGYRGNINMCTVGFCINKNDIWANGFTIRCLNYGEIDGYNQDGDFEKTFSSQDIALGGGVSRKIFDNFYAGAEINFVYSKLEDISSFGLAFTMGVYYNKNGFSAGFSICDLGTMLKPYYKNCYENISSTVQIGVSQQLNHAPITFSIIFCDIQKWKLAYSDNASFVENLVDHFIISAVFFSEKPFSLLMGFNFLKHNELKLTGANAFPGGSVGFLVNLKRFSFGCSHYFSAYNVEMRFSF